ncbi:MAG: DinB family protein [Acidobacteriota bacterium]|nr:DinB family protein [Acidobacteriota bacterium]
MSQTPPTVRAQAAGLRDELQAVRTRFEAVIARADTSAIFSRQPASGSWSAGQCLEHLNHTNRAYLAKLRPALASAVPGTGDVTAPLLSSWFGRKFAASMDEQVSFKARAPKSVVPAVTLDRDAVTGEFRRLLGEMEAVLDRSRAIDLNRVTFPSPLFRLVKMRAGTALRILLAHMRRHLAQAERALDWHAP